MLSLLASDSMPSAIATTSFSMSGPPFELKANLLQGCIPIRILFTGVRAGVGVTNSNGEYIFTSRWFPFMMAFLCDERGVDDFLAGP
jgi:hypothetical protein